jgi:hypothetical protein
LQKALRDEKLDNCARVAAREFVGERAGSVKIGFAEQLNLVDLEGG